MCVCVCVCVCVQGKRGVATMKFPGVLSSVLHFHILTFRIVPNFTNEFPAVKVNRKSLYNSDYTMYM